MNNITIRFRFDKKNEATKTKMGLLQVKVRELGTSNCIDSVKEILRKVNLSDENIIDVFKSLNLV